MDGNKRERQVRRLAPSTFTYAEVEGALAKLYAADAVQKTTFRARLKHFRKLGIPQRQPGKGSRLRYTPADVFQLMVACEFAEFGINPHLITDIVRRHWRMKGSLIDAIDYTQRILGKDPGNDFHVAVESHFMSWDWNREKVKHTATEISVRVVAEPVRIQVFKASDNQAFLEALKDGQRFFVFNLSARVRALEQALSKSESA
jgi:hypothetical protein